MDFELKDGAGWECRLGQKFSSRTDLSPSLVFSKTDQKLLIAPSLFHQVEHWFCLRSSTKWVRDRDYFYRPRTFDYFASTVTHCGVYGNSADCIQMDNLWFLICYQSISKWILSLSLLLCSLFFKWLWLLLLVVCIFLLSAFNQSPISCVMHQEINPRADTPDLQVLSKGPCDLWQIP